MLIDDIINKKGNISEDEYIGLCENCTNAPTCKLPKNPEKPVLQCEEYSLRTPDSGNSIVKNGPVKKYEQVFPENTEDKDYIVYKGLCENCEDREICKYPKPYGGVWHCEGYR